LPVGLLLTVQGAAQLGLELRVGNGVHGLVRQGLQNALVFRAQKSGKMDHSGEEKSEIE